TNHLLLLLLRAPGEGGFFHRFVTGLMVLWAAGAGAFQWLAVRPRWRSVAVYGWAALDVVLYTALLWVKDEPASPLLVGYLLLIAVAALRFRVALVWFVTELCLGAYLGLALKAHWRRPEDAGALPHVPAVFGLSLLLMGMIQSFLLARARRSLPEHRPGGCPRQHRRPRRQKRGRRVGGYPPAPSWEGRRSEVLRAGHLAAGGADELGERADQHGLVHEA